VEKLQILKSSKEFNEKYKDFLEENYYGCSLDLPEALEYLDVKFQEFVKRPDFKYHQIKSKWNYFCFYAKGLSNEERSEVELELNRIYSYEN